MRRLATRLPAVRLAEPGAHTRSQLAEAMPHLFYGLITFALLAVAFGAPGLGLLFLVLGGAAHVARVGAEVSAARPAAPRRRLGEHPRFGSGSAPRAARYRADLSRQLLP